MAQWELIMVLECNKNTTKWLSLHQEALKILRKPPEPYRENRFISRVVDWWCRCTVWANFAAKPLPVSTN